ncbi:MAG: protease complex subunit PrcB family protein [Planctomycetota bacterium]
MPSLSILIGTLAAVGLALGVGVACRSKDCAEPPVIELDVRDLGQASQSRVREQRVVVARDAQAWSQLWSEHSGLQLPSSPAPEVDFTREMVVAVFLGERPTGGFEVHIDSVTSTPVALVVKASSTAPNPDAMVTQALTAPMHAVAVPQTDGEPALALE